MKCFIQKGDLIRLDGDARKLQVICERGIVWITQPNSPRDTLALRAQRRHKIGLVTRVMASVHAAAS